MVPLSSIRYAGLGPRVVAFLWDFLLIAAYIIVLTLLVRLLLAFGLSGAAAAIFSSPVRADLFAFFALILPVIIYFTLGESSLAQATWGKRRAGVSVISTAGGRLSRPQAFLRSLVKFIPWQIAHTSLFNIPGWPLNPQPPSPWVIAGFTVVWILVLLYLLSLALTPTHRAPYDWLAGSAVVYKDTLQT